jgi:hypothetical protein
MIKGNEKTKVQAQGRDFSEIPWKLEELIDFY